MTPETVREAGTTDHAVRWRVLAGASAVVFAVLLDSTIVGVALPTIDDDLGLSSVGSHWVVNAYLLTFAIFAAPGGRLADLVGHRRAFVFGTTAFAAASVACALAANGWWLIAARSVQGVFAAVMLPAALALVANAFDDDERPKAIGIWGGVGTIGMVLGPLLGGTLTEFADWRAIFLVNVPVAAVGIVLVLGAGATTLDVRPTATPARFDWPGLVALTIALGTLVTTLMQVTEWGWTSARTITFAAVGIAAAIAFVLIETRVTDPLIDLRILRQRTFVAANFVMLCLQFTTVAITVFLAIFLQVSEGMSAATAGIATVPALILVPIANPVAGSLVSRVGVRRLLVVGCTATAVSLAWIGAFAGTSTYWLIVPGLALWGVGMPFATNPSMTTAIESVDEDRRAVVGGIVQTGRQIGLALGVAVLSIVIISAGGSGLGSDADDPSNDGYQLAFLICAVVMVVAAFGARALLDPDPGRAESTDPGSEGHSTNVPS